MYRTLPATLLALGLLLVAGCGAGPAPDVAEERPRRPAQQGRAAPTVEPGRQDVAPRQRPGRRAVVPGRPAPSPTSQPLEIEYVGPVGRHLLAARHLGSTWSVEATTDEDGRPMSRCQRAAMSDIGALTTKVREFTAGDARAGQALSRFADRQSAWRAEQVLVAWRDECARQLRRRGAALGTVRHRAWLSVVEVRGVDRPHRLLRRALRRLRTTFG